MLVLLDSQVVALTDLLTKILVRDPYEVAKLEQAILWLTEESNGDRVNCPLERWAMGKFADELISAIKQKDSEVR
jgi:hypothetical protein